MTRGMRGRRLVPFYRATCNGGGSFGCDWQYEGSDYRFVRLHAEVHASIRSHETLVQNLNDGIVFDGRSK